MKKYFIIFIILSFYSFVNAQQLKKYSGEYVANYNKTFSNCDIVGNANYTYTDCDTGRVYNGAFVFKSNPAQPGLTGDLTITGNYENNKKIGKWTYIGTSLVSLLMGPYYIFEITEDYLPENNLLNFTSNRKGPYKSGKPLTYDHQCPMSFQNIDIKCSFQNHQLHGGYFYKLTQEKKEYKTNYSETIIGNFDMGLFSGTETEKYTEKKIDYYIKSEYYKGVRIYYSKTDYSTGEITTETNNSDTVLINKIVQKLIAQEIESKTLYYKQIEIDGNIYMIESGNIMTDDNYTIPSFSNIRGNYNIVAPISLSIKYDEYKTEKRKENSEYEYRNLIEEGDNYYQQNKYNDAIDKYKLAYNLKKSTELSDKINSLQKFIDNEKITHPIIIKGDEFFSEKKYEEAIKEYELAYSISPNKDINNKINYVKEQIIYEAHISKGDVFFNSNKLNNALTEYKLAQKIRNADTLNERIKKTIKFINFNEAKTKGDDFFIAKKYKEALTEYYHAKEIISSKEIIEKINETNKEIERIRNLQNLRLDLFQRVTYEYKILSKRAFLYIPIITEYKKTYAKNYEKCIIFLNNNCLNYLTIVSDIFKTNNTTGLEIQDTWNELDQKAFDNLKNLDEELKVFTKFFNIIAKSLRYNDKKSLKLLKHSDEPLEIINKIILLPYDEKIDKF